MAQQYPIDNPIFFDAEIYPGWWEFGLKYDGAVYQLRSDQDGAAEVLTNWIQWSRENGVPWVGFNSNHYDDKVMGAAVDGLDPYVVSCDIIQNDAVPWKYESAVPSIDLMRILPGFMSLKKLGVCLGWKKLQELPVRFDITPDDGQRTEISKYNVNDLDITELLYHEIYDEIKLRQVMSERYNTDVRSQGEATMAETILLHELRARGDERTKKQLNNDAVFEAERGPVQITAPFWWGMVDDKLPIVSRIGDRIFSTQIPVTADGKLSNTIFKGKVMIGDRFYQMGVGGLHSIDGPGAWVPKGEQKLFDIDVTSYYPNIILSNQLYPRVWGPVFLDIYRDIVERRVKAKAAGDKVTADVLKIAANGTFGKTSSYYSSLYDPQMFGSITLYGQLSLLALIEKFSQHHGIYVCSANTDGITVMVENGMCEKVARQLTADWERQTSFTMEWTEYSGLYQRDVNTYLAVKTDGKAKAKGALINKWPDLRHIPSGNIIATAVQKKILGEAEIKDTIERETDINQFIFAHAATGQFKCHWRGEEQGKIVRWYWGLEGDSITKVHPDGRVQQVPRSENAVSVADLPEDFPTDIDYERYIKEAEELYRTITQPKTKGMNEAAAELRKWFLEPAIVDINKISKAGVEWGDTDFTSMREGECLGVKTGNGIMAKVYKDWRKTELYVVDRSKGWPAKTRDLVDRKHGFTMYYGARIAIQEPGCPIVSSEEFEQWYTVGELKKVRGG